MTDNQQSYDVNRANWDERAPAHAASPGYSVERFATDPDFLSNTVRFDLPRLGDVNGLRGIHLQCHIGTDTVSLARLGARMTGLDFSPAALTEARALAARSGADVDFVESDVYGAVDALGGPGQFDLVFTGVGALCWLPDIARWAEVVDRLLKPGGRLFLREGHPVLWAIDEAKPDLVLGYPYFETVEPMVFEQEGTYVETAASFLHNVSHSWNHGLGEIVTALLDRGLVLTQLVEHDTAPWDALPGKMQRCGDEGVQHGSPPDSEGVALAGEWRMIEHAERLPLSYTLQAVKPAA